MELRPLPNGVVTFFLTDVEGSTQLWEGGLDGMATALRQHDALMKDVVGRNHGVLVKSKGEGDSCFAVFASARSAVVAASEAQSALADEDWPTSAPLRVRIALHSGEAELRDNDYYGRTVNRCARLRAIAWGGQVVLSQTTADLVADDLSAEMWLRDLGVHGLKDLERPEHVYQLCQAARPGDFPRLRSLDSSINNLPSHLSSFIGRDQELAELVGEISVSRLLTITGSGGTGKTRLALQVAADCADVFVEGVWFIDLSSVEDEDGIWQAILQELPCLKRPGAAIDELTLEYLAQRKVLLIFDNCEHLAGESSLVVEGVLEACRDVHILATSREGLGARDEHVYLVDPLSVPAPNDRDVDRLIRSEAVQLFVERATSAARGFRLGEENAEAVRDICRRLDGVPLAIELAAARVPILGSGRLAERLDEAIDVLTASSRMLPSRHRTMHAAVDWSFRLLPSREQYVLTSLAVFEGGFSLDAAEGVVALNDRPMMLESLVHLIEKSLVIKMAPEGERYRLLEPIREFALSKLREASREDEMRTRHERWFIDLAERLGSGLWGPDQERCLSELQADRANLDAVLRTLCTHQAGSQLLGLVSWLGLFWDLRGESREALRWLERALADSRDAPRDVLGRALFIYGNVLAGIDVDAARRAFESELSLAELDCDDVARARALVDLGMLAARTGDPDEALRRANQALPLAEGRDSWQTHRALSLMSGALRSKGDLGKVQDIAAAALVEARAIGTPRLVVRSLVNLAGILSAKGERHRGRTLYLEALDIASRLHLRYESMMILANLSVDAESLGDLAAARRYCEDALAIAHDLGDEADETHLRGNLASLLHAAGAVDDAKALYEEALATARSKGYGRVTPHFIAESARLAIDQLEFEHALSLLLPALDFADENPMARQSVTLCALAAIATCTCEDPQAARRHAERAMRLAMGADEPRCRIEALRATAFVDRARGSLDSARRSLEDARDVALELDEVLDLVQLLGELVTTYVLLSEDRAALAVLAQLVGLRTRMGSLPTPRELAQLEADVNVLCERLGRSEVEAALGDIGWFALLRVPVS